MKRILLFLASAGLSFGATSVSQFGITFNFADDETVGQFANGDYWVLGPVTITSMTPAWDGTYNGWELNPTYSQTQGFYGGNYNYDEAKRPALPWVVNSGSVVKTIGDNPSTRTHTKIKTAVVLTVLTELPPDTTGEGYFRPPYSGTEKPMIPITDLRTDLLPSLPQVSGAPTLANVEADFSKCLRMDHKTSGDNLHGARQFRPIDAMEDYQPKNTAEINEAMLRLMLDDDIEDKMPALIQFTQHGLDRAYIVAQGYRRSATGHNPCQRIMAVWGAWMLDLTDIQTYLSTATGFHEDAFLYLGAQGVVLWGEEGSEAQYLNYLNTGNGSKSVKDPYGDYIDGGNLADGDAYGGGGAAYQSITSQALKGAALIATLIPELQGGWPASNNGLGRNSWDNFSTYAERWVTHGVWASPDPESRFLARHGTGTDNGQYKSAFVASMWDAHFESTPSPGTLNLSASAYSVDEDGGMATISVSRTGGSVGAVGVSYATSDGTAEAGTDYTTASGTLSWADAESGVKTFAVTIADNGDEDGNRTFTVTISSPTGDAELGGTTAAMVTILDDDGANPIPLMADLGPFEAEAGLIEGIFQVSAGLVFQSSQTTTPSNGGLARWRVTIPSTAEYKVTMDIEAEGTSSDSFFVEFDEEPTTPADIWDVQVLTTGVESRDVTIRGSGTFDNPEFSPKVWSLTAGEHTLYVRGREANAAMDNITISEVGGSAPDAPSSLDATPKGLASVVTWVDSSDDETGFRVERYDGDEFAEVAVLGAGETKWRDTSVEPGGRYQYRVRAYNASGNSSYAAPVEVAIKGTGAADSITVGP